MADDLQTFQELVDRGAGADLVGAFAAAMAFRLMDEMKMSPRQTDDSHCAMCGCYTTRAKRGLPCRKCSRKVTWFP